MKHQRVGGWNYLTKPNAATYGFRLHWHGKLWSKESRTSVDKAGWRCVIGAVDCLWFLQFMFCGRTSKRATVDEVRRQKRELSHRASPAR